MKSNQPRRLPISAIFWPTACGMIRGLVIAIVTLGFVGIVRCDDLDGKKNDVRRRKARIQRWELIFRTKDDEDYVRQLNALDAVIGIPDENGRLMIVRNLNERPAKWKYEDLREMNRVYWSDDHEVSAQGVAKFLKMPVIPSMFVVFMARSMEEELVKIELECAKQFSGAKEEDIIRTVFVVSFLKGKPSFTVKSQTTK